MGKTNMRFAIVVAAVAALSLTMPALAQQSEQAQRFAEIDADVGRMFDSGLIGYTLDGYLTARDSTRLTETQRHNLYMSNVRQAARYVQRAAGLGGQPFQVLFQDIQRAGACDAIVNAPTGRYYRLENGEWRRKTSARLELPAFCPPQ